MWNAGVELVKYSHTCALERWNMKQPNFGCFNEQNKIITTSKYGTKKIKENGLSRLKKRFKYIMWYAKNNPNWREEIYNNK